jgi:hypothetical protein
MTLRFAVIIVAGALHGALASHYNYARVVKLVDTTDLKSVEPSSVRTGSIPVPGTNRICCEFNRSCTRVAPTISFRVFPASCYVGFV